MYGVKIQGFDAPEPFWDLEIRVSDACIIYKLSATFSENLSSAGQTSPIPWADVIPRISQASLALFIAGYHAMPQPI